MRITALLVKCKTCEKLIKRKPYHDYEHHNYCNSCWEKAEE